MLTMTVTDPHGHVVAREVFTVTDDSRTFAGFSVGNDAGGLAAVVTEAINNGDVCRFVKIGNVWTDGAL